MRCWECFDERRVYETSKYCCTLTEKEVPAAECLVWEREEGVRGDVFCACYLCAVCGVSFVRTGYIVDGTVLMTH